MTQLLPFRPNRPPCLACAGSGEQLSALDKPRPCSLCRYDDFHLWYARAVDEHHAARKAGE